jgi:uncharacterized protein YbjQ (UPF0145 family)
VLLSTTNTIDGKRIVSYHGLVSGDAILGANIFSDIFAGIRDIVGGRSAAYERELRRAKDIALQEMTDQAKALGANAVIGIDLDLRDRRPGWVDADGECERNGRHLLLRNEERNDKRRTGSNAVHEQRPKRTSLRSGSLLAVLRFVLRPSFLSLGTRAVPVPRASGCECSAS